jgi:hypothetical protein
VDASEEAATVDHQISVKYWARLLKMAREEAQRVWPTNTRLMPVGFSTNFDA